MAKSFELPDDMAQAGQGQGQESASPPEPQSFPEPQSQTTPTEPTSGLDLRGLLSERGYDATGFTDDRSVAEALLAAAEQLEANRRYIQLGQQAAPAWGEFQEWQSQRARPAQADVQAAPRPQVSPQATTSTKPSWSPPQYDPRWEAVCEPDPQRPGMYRPADPMYALAAQKLNDYKAWQRETFGKLLQNPLEVLDQAGLNERLAEFEEKLVQKYQRALQDYDALQQQRQYVSSNVSQFFQVDEAGRPRFDGAGQPLLTPMGRAFEFYEAEARQFGLQDPLVIQRYVERQLEADRAMGRIPASASAQQTPTAPGPAPPSQAPSPRDVGRQKQERFMDRAAEIARNRNGTEHPGEPAGDDLPSQNPDAGLVELAHREMRKRGMLPQKG